MKKRATLLCAVLAGVAIALGGTAYPSLYISRATFAASSALFSTR